MKKILSLMIQTLLIHLSRSPEDIKVAHWTHEWTGSVLRIDTGG